MLVSWFLVDKSDEKYWRMKVWNVGYKFCGTMFQGQRPDRITFSSQELEDYIDEYGEERLANWWYSCLLPALKHGGTIDINFVEEQPLVIF